jgi:hypothetical protein
MDPPGRDVTEAPWRAKARELVPELDKGCHPIAELEGPMMLWIELGMLFEDAYEAEPPNEDLIRRIYELAFWCLEHGQRHPTDAGRDLPTCVAVAFLEHIPAHPEARADMPRWFTREEILHMRGIFSYLIGEDEYDRLIREQPLPVSNRQAKREARKANRQRKPWSRPPS